MPRCSRRFSALFASVRQTTRRRTRASIGCAVHRSNHVFPSVGHLTICAASFPRRQGREPICVRSGAPNLIRFPVAIRSARRPQRRCSSVAGAET
jgi:hypothetical protein